MKKLLINYYSKVKQYGYKKSIYIFLDKIFKLNYWRQCSIPWSIKPIFYINFFSFLFSSKVKGKRILGIWDYKYLPWSIGDPLIFIEVLSVLKLKFKAKYVDICIVYDIKDPAGIRRGWSNLNSDNLNDYALNHLQLFSTCPYLGSIHQFNSRKELNIFLKQNIKRYFFYPTLEEYMAENFIYKNGAEIYEIIEFYKTNKYIPYLKISNENINWAYKFYCDILPAKKIPVTISFKLTSHDTRRNPSIEEWKTFFTICRKKYPEIHFVLIGCREEIVENMKKNENVIFAKEYGTSIIEDFALIRTSITYMGVTSGINIISQFSDLPYLVFRYNAYKANFMREGESWIWANENQKIFSESLGDSAELLISEFSKIYEQLDKNEWINIAQANSEEKLTLPGARV